MQAEAGGHEVVVAVASFHYDVPGRTLRKVARRGETIVVNDDDYEFGNRLGALLPAGEDLTHHGTLPEFPDDGTQSEVDAWMRSASAAEVAAALEAATAEGVDVSAAMLTGELSRGTEARGEVLEVLENHEPPNTGTNDGDDGGDGEDPVRGNIPDVLKRVGTNADLAEAALDAEQAKGDKARKSLVTKLQDVIAAAEA